MIWAIRIRYRMIGEQKWRQHTTKWYDNSGDAWAEKERWERQVKNVSEAASSLIHKER